jgi:hypothetical protein
MDNFNSRADRTPHCSEFCKPKQCTLVGQEGNDDKFALGRGRVDFIRTKTNKTCIILFKAWILEGQ